MNQIFNLLGSLFGYVLDFSFNIFNNYGIAIIVFTLILRFFMFPFSLKQQKSMVMQSRLNNKLQDLKKKYANDTNKYNEEMQKLYEKEGFSPTSGCMTSFLPMFFMLGIYYSVIYPLTNTLHLAADKVQSAMEVINSLPGMGIGQASSTSYVQISFLTAFNKLGDLVNDLGFNASELEKITHFSNGFNFLGLDLLETPSNYGVFSIYFLIPLLSFLTSVFSSLITTKITGNGAAQPGCMKLMFVVLPLFTAWIAYSVPSAVGFYWICSTVINFFMTLIINKFYNVETLTAREEAQHIALLRIQESK